MKSEHTISSVVCTDCGAVLEFSVSWAHRPRPYLQRAAGELILAVHKRKECTKEQLS